MILNAYQCNGACQAGSQFWLAYSLWLFSDSLHQTYSRFLLLDCPQIPQLYTYELNVKMQECCDNRLGIGFELLMFWNSVAHMGCYLWISSQGPFYHWPFFTARVTPNPCKTLDRQWIQTTLTCIDILDINPTQERVLLQIRSWTLCIFCEFPKGQGPSARLIAELYRLKGLLPLIPAVQFEVATFGVGPCDLLGVLWRKRHLEISG